MTGQRILFHIPDYWTQEQAYAVYELLQDLSECIMLRYSQEIIDECRQQHMPCDLSIGESAYSSSCDLDDVDPSF
jgi:hypothetical protein